MFQWIGILIAALLTGCANTGVLSKDAAPAETFEVAADFQAAYRRAAEYVRVCHEHALHPYGVGYASRRIVGEKGAPNQIYVYKASEPTKILEVIQSQTLTPNTSRVKVIVLGEGQWDVAEIAAAKASIQGATPVCRKSAGG